MTGKTLGETPVLELLKGARTDLIGLAGKLEKMGVEVGGERSRGDALLLGAYFGSIGARIAVAEIKIEEAENQSPVRRNPPAGQMRCEMSQRDWQCGDTAQFNCWTEVRNRFACDGHIGQTVRDLRSEAAKGGYNVLVTVDLMD